MSSGISEAAQRLRGIIQAANAAAVIAKSAQVDAEETHNIFAHVGQGSHNPDLRRAVTGAVAAAQELGEVTRLLSEASEAFTDYLDVLLLSAGKTGSSLETTPSGERLLDEAEQRPGAGSRSSPTPKTPTRSERRRKAPERRDSNVRRSNPPPRKERVSVEAIGAAGATAGAIWAGLAELMPLPVKAVGGAVVGAIGAVAAVKLWTDKRRKEREEDK